MALELTEFLEFFLEAKSLKADLDKEKYSCVIEESCFLFLMFAILFNTDFCFAIDNSIFW